MSKKPEINEEIKPEINEEINEDKKVENIEIEDEKIHNETLNYLVSLRGFKSFEDCEEYINSDAFDRLDKYNQDELLTWFKNLK